MARQPAAQAPSRQNRLRAVWIPILLGSAVLLLLPPKETAFYAQQAYGRALLKAPTSLFHHPFHPLFPYFPTSPLVDALAALTSPISALILRTLLFLAIAFFLIPETNPPLVLFSLLGALLYQRPNSFFSPLFFAVCAALLFTFSLKRGKRGLLLLSLLLWSLSHESFLLGNLLLFFETPLPFALSALLLTSVPLVSALSYLVQVSWLDRLLFFPSWQFLFFLPALFTLLPSSKRERVATVFLLATSFYLLFPFYAFLQGTFQLFETYRPFVQRMGETPLFQDLYLPHTQRLLQGMSLLFSLFLLSTLRHFQTPVDEREIPFVQKLPSTPQKAVCSEASIGDRLLREGFRYPLIDSKRLYAYPPSFVRNLTFPSPATLQLPCSGFYVSRDAPLFSALSKSPFFLLAQRQKRYALFLRASDQNFSAVSPALKRAASQNMGTFYLLLAQQKTREKKTKEAIQRLQKALTFSPSAEAMTNLASLYIQTGKIQEAKKWLNQAKKKAPLHPGVLCNEALLEERQKAYVQALSLYKKCRDFAPQNPAIDAAIARVQKKIK